MKNDAPTECWVKVTDSADYNSRGCLALMLSVIKGMSHDEACAFAGTKATNVEAPEVYEN